jgi:hypothetical protein
VIIVLPRHEYARDLTESKSVILDMLDNIGRQDKIKARVFERQVAYVSAADQPETLLRTKPDRFVAEIQSDNAAITKFCKQAQIGAGACADIEDGGILRGAKPGNLAAIQAAPTDEPPMRFFDFRFYGVRSYVHRLLIGQCPSLCRDRIRHLLH